MVYVIFCPRFVTADSSNFLFYVTKCFQTTVYFTVHPPPSKYVPTNESVKELSRP